mgnify:CR=1 FL=1
MRRLFLCSNLDPADLGHTSQMEPNRTNLREPRPNEQRSLSHPRLLRNRHLRLNNRRGTRLANGLVHRKKQIKMAQRHRHPSRHTLHCPNSHSRVFITTLLE